MSTSLLPAVVSRLKLCAQPAAALLLILLCVEPGSGGLRAAERPSVASINLCTDQLLLLLADAQQIRSLSSLARQQAGSYYHLRARDFASNAGHAEQILPLAPDLVLAGSFSNPHSVTLMRELGLRVETLPLAHSVEDVLNNIQLVANWLGQGARGEQIVNDLQQRLQRLLPPPGHRPQAAIYDPNGYTVGNQSLRGQMLELAGWENTASRANIDNYGRLSLETLIRLSPQALIDSPYSAGTWSRAQALTRHPALREAGLDPLIIQVPSNMTICGGPWTLDVIEQLQVQRLRLAATLQ